MLPTLPFIWKKCIKKGKIIAFEDEEPPSYDEAINTRELEPPTYAQAQFMFESVM